MPLIYKKKGFGSFVELVEELRKGKPEPSEAQIRGLKIVLGSLKSNYCLSCKLRVRTKAEKSAHLQETGHDDVCPSSEVLKLMVGGMLRIERIVLPAQWWEILEHEFCASVTASPSVSVSLPALLSSTPSLLSSQPTISPSGPSNSPVLSSSPPSTLPAARLSPALPPPPPASSSAPVPSQSAPDPASTTPVVRNSPRLRNSSAVVSKKRLEWRKELDALKREYASAEQETLAAWREKIMAESEEAALEALIEPAEAEVLDCEVDRIVGHFYEGADLFYFVRWRGPYPRETVTPAKDVDKADKALREYWMSLSLKILKDLNLFSLISEK
jgi:hypothetical protein